MIIIQNKSNISDYIYFITYRRDQKQICGLEMKSIFGYYPKDNFIHTTNQVDIDRSVYLRSKLDIIFKAENISDIVQMVSDVNLTLNNYKIRYLKTKDYVEYNERLHAMREIGTAITGEFAIKEPDVALGITKVDGIWMFGYYIKNTDTWIERIQKPHNYSYALEVRLAKSILNIAIENNQKLSIIDPCCGIGTVLIEGRAMNLNISGYEINDVVSNYGNENLESFGFKGDIQNINMLESREKFDVAILDIPYGQFSLTTKDEQLQLLRKTRELAETQVIVSMEDISKTLQDCEFDIIDKVELAKSNSFSRFIYKTKKSRL